MKYCSKCKQTKELSEFASDKSKSDGKQAYCKDCDNKKVREYYHRNKDKFEKRRKENPDYIRNHYYKSEYGITVGEYESLFESQGGVCAICGNKPDDGRRLAVDHDHRTNKVRGLLCRNCNTSLGNTNDNISILEKMINYLRKEI